MTTTPFSRRSLLGGALATLAIGTSVGLAGCQGSGPTGGSGGGTVVSDELLPRRQGETPVAPDLVSADPNALNGYLTYPADRAATYETPPFSEGEFGSLCWTFDPIAPPLGENQLWQRVNELLGATANITYLPNADYRARFSTTIAGGNLPDTVALSLPTQQLPALMRSTFADLTEHLAGDAVAEYPNLALLPTDAWRSAVIDGALRAVPIPRPPMGAVAFIRTDVMEAKGLPVQPADFSEFATLLEGLTDERAGTWASADIGGTLNFVLAALGVPQPWIEQGGQFTFNGETEQFTEGLARIAELYGKGVFHPDALASTNTQRNDWLVQGTAPILYAGFVGWSKFPLAGAAIDGFGFGAMKPFGFDAQTTPQHARGNVAGALVAINRASDRVPDILRYMDYLASPFGTREHLARKFGVEGVTFEFDGGEPTLTSAGQNQSKVPFGFVADGPYPIYNPGQPDITQAMFDYQEAILPQLAPDPTIGLYSETYAQKWNTLQGDLIDVQNAICQGRAPVGDWEAAISSWRSGGGDQIREEYQSALAAAQ